MENKANKLHVKRDDDVVVITGKDKGARGKIVSADPQKGRVVVQGVNIIHRHTKPKKAQDPGGILKKESPIDASDVMLYCGKCKSGHRARIRINKGKKERVCVKCNTSFDK